MKASFSYKHEQRKCDWLFKPATSHLLGGRGGVEAVLYQQGYLLILNGKHWFIIRSPIHTKKSKWCGFEQYFIKHKFCLIKYSLKPHLLDFLYFFCQNWCSKFFHFKSAWYMQRRHRLVQTNGLLSTLKWWEKNWFSWDSFQMSSG